MVVFTMSFIAVSLWLGRDAGVEPLAGAQPLLSF